MVLKKTKETYNIKGKHYMNDQRNIIVIGGGAAGMIAAIAAAKEGCRVSLYEKNEKLGK